MLDPTVYVKELSLTQCGFNEFDFYLVTTVFAI